MRRHIDLRPLRRQPLAALERGRRRRPPRETDEYRGGETKGSQFLRLVFFDLFSLGGTVKRSRPRPSSQTHKHTHRHTHTLASIFSLTSRPRSKQEALLSASDSASPRNSKTPQEFDQMLVSSLCVASVRQPASAFKKRKPSEACTTMTDDENILERRGVFFVFLCPDLTDPKRLIPNLD